MLHAVAYRDRQFQRSQEEIWLVADLSAARSLTTPEVEAVLEATEAEQCARGTGQYVTWLIAGETVSPDAVELIRKRKVFCSSIEQLVLLREMLGVSRPTNGEPGQPAMESTPEVTTRAPAERAGVVPLDRREANTELSSLRLPASQDSEYLAALVAEKLAVKGGFGENEAGKIKTSVLEGVLNAIEHSSNPEKLIEIEMRVEPRGMEVRIMNEGAEFDPLAVPEPDAKSKLRAPNKRGWGIMLMKRFMTRSAMSLGAAALACAW